MNFKEAGEFFLQCIGGLAIIAFVFGVILYKILIINPVKKEQEEANEPHFIDELLEQ